MNVIISNKYQSMIDSLNLDTLKILNGEFEVDEIISQFQNLFYQRMILDVTALKNYHDIKTLQKLSISLDMDKLILLIDDTVDDGTGTYLSKLISMGIYNFTKNAEGILYLYNNPNSYRDVAHIQQLDVEPAHTEISVDTYENTVPTGPTIIGIKNVTKQSGATTLTYMMKNQLKENYSVVAIEVNKSDFRYFNDKSLISTTNFEIGNVLAKHSDNDVILIDVNDSKQAEDLCNEIIYLIEPSIIKLNKLVLVNNNIFKTLKNKKVILNQSLLSSKDVLDFEYESGLKIYYNMPPLDEREKSIYSLNTFLVRLGFTKQKSEEQEKKKSILGIFGK